MDHIRRLLEEAYPNHVYPIRHKLKYYSMMRSFITSRSLT
jgi:Ni,Fe-hydrogenase III component G